MGNHDKTCTQLLEIYRKSDHQVPGVSREKRIVMHASNLRRRRNLTAG